MKRKNYAVTNLSYKDETRKSDYLYVEAGGEGNFNIPDSMDVMPVMFPSDEIDFTSQDTLQSLTVDYPETN